MYLGTKTVSERRWRQEGSVGVFGGWTTREVPYQAEVEKHLYRCERCAKEFAFPVAVEGSEPFFCNCGALVGILPNFIRHLLDRLLADARRFEPSFGDLRSLSDDDQDRLAGIWVNVYRLREMA